MNRICRMFGIMALVPQVVWAAGGKSARPNVIYVFPDQLRNCALNFWNEPGFREKVNFRADPTRTPNINAFARESVVLTSAISNFPLSSPHRGSLLTGMYPNRSGVPLNCNSNRPISYIRPGTVCISDVFRQAGYDCAYIGKLHTDYPVKNDPDRPGRYVEDRVPAWDAYTPPERRHGFDFWYSYGTFDVHKNPHYWDNKGHKHEPHEWSSLHEARVAISYIRNQGKVRDSKKPFFMMIGMNPPHGPYSSNVDCMAEDLAFYKDKPVDSLLIRPNANRKMQKAQSAQYYFASITGVDRAFGMILRALHEQGLDRNTIVVFASDHGETMCSQGTDDPKNSPYIEALNIPFLVRYPALLKPRVDSMMLSTPDIMPTVLGLAGLDRFIPKSVQGRDLSPLFFNENAPIRRPSAALYLQNLDGKENAEGKTIDYFPSARGIKTRHHTLALYINRENQLKRTLFFDDRVDPYQMVNLDPKTHVAVFKKLCHRMGKMLKKIGDPWYKKKILKGIVTYD